MTIGRVEFLSQKFLETKSYHLEVLNEVYLQNFLHEWVVNHETDLMNLLNL